MEKFFQMLWSISDIVNIYREVLVVWGIDRILISQSVLHTYSVSEVSFWKMNEFAIILLHKYLEYSSSILAIKAGDLYTYRHLSSEAWKVLGKPTRLSKLVPIRGHSNNHWPWTLVHLFPWDLVQTSYTPHMVPVDSNFTSCIII